MDCPADLVLRVGVQVGEGGELFPALLVGERIREDGVLGHFGEVDVAAHVVEVGAVVLPHEEELAAVAELRRLPWRGFTDRFSEMSITLEVDEATLLALPLGPGERERHMQIELACRYYAKGWLSLGQASRMAGLDQFGFACELAERGIPRNYSVQDTLHDVTDARRQ